MQNKSQAPRHFAHWPPGLPRHLSIPETHLFHNLQVSAARFPHKVAIDYYGSALSYAALLDACERLAGWLQVQGVQRGDRVLLYLQNSPQWVIGYYAILRADAVVVPVNPMNRRDELQHYVDDTGARNHLTYLGDAVIGSKVNVGAGTITCNYDGVNKSTTTIEDGAFIGSNSSLVAPVTVGRDATLAAGTVLTRNAPAGQLTVARARQSTVEGWKRPEKKPR